jgi:ABC-type sugar transport system ATPase subunit
MAIVQVEHVNKRYQLGEQEVQALHNVSRAIEPGVFLAIAGPSGSGKSTLLNIFGCIDTPSSGRVLIDGRDVSGQTPDQLAGLPPHGRAHPQADAPDQPRVRHHLRVLHPRQTGHEHGRSSSQY